jgi:hypothetical protein
MGPAADERHRAVTPGEARELLASTSEEARPYIRLGILDNLVNGLPDVAIGEVDPVALRESAALADVLVEGEKDAALRAALARLQVTFEAAAAGGTTTAVAAACEALLDAALAAPWIATVRQVLASALVPAQIPDAFVAGNRFWQALASNDDDTLLKILAASVLEVLGHGPLEARSKHAIGDPLTQPGLAIAARLRAHVGYERNDCARMSPATIVNILSPTAVRLFYMPADDEVPFEAGTSLSGRFLELDLDEGRWLVDPIRAHDRPEIAQFTFAGE